MIWPNLPPFAYKNSIRKPDNWCNPDRRRQLLVNWFLRGMPNLVLVILVLARSLGIIQGNFACVRCQD